MAIEGPLRELGIHDVFQLLDLSRKTGTLHVRSTLRDNEGTIFFGDGRVVYASIRSNPHPLGEMLLRTGKIGEADLERAISMQRERRASHMLGDILIEMGVITRRELERQMRFQVEEVVFELMSWNEGFFTFEEGGDAELLPDVTVSISTESLLMEGARRIDEWSRIATRISDLTMVPSLADTSDDRPAQLDLLPNEWEVLSMVDSARTVREISQALGRSDFEVARVLYGLVCTGVVAMARANGGDAPEMRPTPMGSRIIMDAGDDGAAMQALSSAFASARAGKLDDAITSWNQYLALRPDGTDAEHVKAAVAHADELRTFIQAYYNG